MLAGWQVILFAGCGREVRRVCHNHPAPGQAVQRVKWESIRAESHEG
ncbi:MAG: hypothetical protein WAM60_09150 [Candidatus Promineifilaceae bacterium]